MISDWSDVFEKIGLYTASRAEVYGLLKKDRHPVTSHTISEALIRLRKLHYPDFLGTNLLFLADEFPELIDDEILSLCKNINTLGFVKTVNSCSGHLIHDCWIGGERNGYGKYRKGLPFVYGYCFPYLSLLFDVSDSRSRQAIEALHNELNRFGTLPRILTQEKTETKLEFVIKSEKTKVIDLTDFHLEEHSYFAIFYPTEFEQSALRNFNLVNRKLVERLTHEQYADFAVSDEVHQKAKSFFTIFSDVFQTTAPFL